MPISYIEALGRATVARAQLELSFDLLLVILAIEPTRLNRCWPRDPFGTKVDYLRTVSRSRLLKHDWWRTLRRIAAHAKKLDQHYSEAAMSSIYGRGGGFLEDMMRPLAQKLDLAPPSLTMTPAKLALVTEQFKQLAQDACNLATALLEGVERLSIAREAP